MEVLLVLQVIVVVALIAVILVQKSGSDGFTGASSPNSFLTGRASANLFTHITSVLAAIFIINSLVLAYIASHTERASAILEQAADEAAKENKDNKTTKGSLSDLQQKMNKLNSPAGKTEQPAQQPAKPVENKTEEKSGDKPAEPAEQKPASTPSVPVSE